MPGKAEIRKAVREERRKVAPAARIAASLSVCSGILARKDVQEAIGARRPFAVYLATAEELDLSPLIERLWAAECPVFIPAWRSGAYELTRYAPETELVPGPMGILEPQPGREEDRPAPAVWIVPGLAFTRQGARLGYGGGWYDRFLASAPQGALSFGVAYPFQIFDELPIEGHDIVLSDVIVAEGERSSLAV